MTKTRLIEILRAVKEGRSDPDACSSYVSINYGPNGLKLFKEYLSLIKSKDAVVDHYDYADRIEMAFLNTLDHA